MRALSVTAAVAGGLAASCLLVTAFAGLSPPAPAPITAPVTAPTPSPAPATPAPAAVSPSAPLLGPPQDLSAAVPIPADPPPADPKPPTDPKPKVAAPARPVSPKPAPEPAAAPERPEIVSVAPPALPAVDPEQTVRNTIRLSISAFEACYQNSLRRDSRIKGRIVVSVSVLASGRVSAAKLDETTIRDDGVITCITSRLKGLRFPPLGEDVEVTLPLSLVPREG